MTTKKNKKANIHDQTLDRLVKRISSRYQKLSIKMEYSRRGYVGEVDVLAYNGDRYVFFEIKSR